MLPASTSPWSNRSDRPDGRATEIQRLIGRSHRAVVDLEAVGRLAKLGIAQLTDPQKETLGELWPF